MNQNSLISVIVPVYNVEKYLPWCLDSVLAQTYRLFELILVDDGSTDGSVTICDEYASRDARVKVIHQDNGGPSAARNAALDIMQGEYVAFIDADDVVHEKYLERLMQNLEIFGADISSVTFCRIPEQGKLSVADTSGAIATYSAEKAIRKILYQNQLENSAWGKVYKACLWDGIRFPSDIYYEDLAIFYKIYERASKVVHETAMLYGYRQRPSSIMGNFTLKRADVLEVVDGFVEDIRRRHPSLLRAALDRKFSANMNILWLMTATGVSDDTIIARCWANIKSLRCQSLFNRRVRLKNRLGALISYCGLKPLRLLFRHFPA